MIGPREIVVDNFAGGGGASAGIEAGTGRPVDIAINHDPEAIAMHRVNHPHTQHYCESVWDVHPLAITRGRPVAFGWFSPDCTYHSKARGGKPFRERDTARRRRGLAGIVPWWLELTGMRGFYCENVEEFADWGPLLPDGRPCPRRRGLSFRRWHRRIENIISRRTGLPYRIDMRELRACDYGAPTTRKRLFVIGRCDGEEIVFPEAIHGPGLQPYRTAGECIDWSIPTPSIFEPGRDLVPNTLRRIARGIRRFVVDDPNPFIVQPTVSGLIPTTHNTRDGLVAAFLAKHYGGNESPGCSLRSPMSAITTVDHHALVTAFLLKYYGTATGASLNDPLHAITTRDRFALVTIRGTPYQFADIGMRHLAPPELFRAQSFPANYIIDHGIDEHGQRIELTKKAQIRMCGNSVPPSVAEALVSANFNNQACKVAA